MHMNDEAKIYKLSFPTFPKHMRVSINHPQVFYTYTYISGFQPSSICVYPGSDRLFFLSLGPKMVTSWWILMNFPAFPIVIFSQDVDVFFPPAIPMSKKSVYYPLVN